MSELGGGERKRERDWVCLWEKGDSLTTQIFKKKELKYLSKYYFDSILTIFKASLRQYSS